MRSRIDPLGTRLSRLLLLFLAIAFLSPSPARGQQTSTVLFLVRHAEKAAEPADDPPLNEDGQRRSQELAELLVDANLQAIYSSDYLRTRDTAAPVSRASGVDVELYDPGDLEPFAEMLKTGTKSALVVGHSNTTPVLVELLGGVPGDPIDEPAEYDRLYILTFTGDAVVTTLLRYGAPFRRGR